MTADNPPENRKSLIIRAWREHKDERTIWHFRVQNVLDNQQHGFAGVADLLTYLQDCFRDEDDTR